ncbi:MAG: ABC transporter permease [Lachnospiraceae bacterium]|nr:ABC transporter permease [Lachnospiraceae bacterium]
MVFTRRRLSIPYIIFVLGFVILPLLVVLYYAFTNGQGQLTVENFQGFFTNGKTMGTLFYSLVIAAVTTFFCLLLAYPTAYILARGNFSRNGVWMILIVTPMWINFTLRITAIKEILSLLEGNLAMYPFFNTILCMVYDFLPFMILPIYTAILKLDDALPEAAADLGAKKTQVFMKVMLPLSMPGIVSGITMVFLPAMTNYVVLDMVYNSTYIMGSLIGSYFYAYDWHNGSMISMVLLIIIFVISWFTGKLSDDAENQRGGAV